MSDSFIPGTTLQRGTPWLAATRMLPEPRPAQDDSGQGPARPGRLASVLSGLTRPTRPGGTTSAA